MSGATGLVWQTVWARELHLVFGTSTFAIATVLSAFMLGLALGGLLAARFADKARHPIVVYGLLELGIGLYGAVFPWIVTAIAPIYLSIWAWAPTPVEFGVFQGLLCGAALVFPTTLMGATLPVLARFATDRIGAAGDRISLLYAINTFGAIVGTAVCGFILLPWLGTSATTWITAAGNIALGAAALAIAYSTPGSESAPVERDVEPAHVPALVRVATVSALAGFASLVYEVAWTRLLVLMLGASVYAFTVMLLAFLTGIALGGRAGGPIGDRLLRRFGTPGVLAALAVCELGVGGLAWAMMFVFPQLPYAYVQLFDAFGAQSTPGAVYVVSLLLAGLVMTPPASARARGAAGRPRARPSRPASNDRA